MPVPLGPHDLGTLPAIGSSSSLPEKGDRIHAFWERQVHATVMLLVAKGHMKIDEVRRGQEYLEPQVYQTASYYEKWALSVANAMLEHQVLSNQELSAALGPETEDEVQRFFPGDVVRVRDASHTTRWRRPHLRTPGFIHGVCGTIERHVGNFENPEQLAFGGKSWSTIPLYIVRFDASSIQDFDSGERGMDQVTVDIYQSWLAPADAAALEGQRKKRPADLAAEQPQSHPDCKRARTDEHTAHQDHVHDHVHEERHTVEQRAVDAEAACPAIARALVSALLTKGVIGAEELRAGIEKVDAGDRNRGAVGRRVVARAWADEKFKSRLLSDANSACSELGITATNPTAPTKLVVFEQKPQEHHLIVCTLCSCYPLTLLGLSPDWYKSREYRSRAVREPRAVLKEFGTHIPADTQVVVHDSTADCRFLVLPNRPKGTEAWSEEKLQEIITRDSMIGALELGNLIEKYDLDGVDYNWEYPGYRFGQGYLSDTEVQADYRGLSKLAFATREMYAKRGWTSKVITLAYYPDGRQEQLLKEYGLPEVVDLLHMMSYDQGGGHHSSLDYGKKSADQGTQILPARQLTMGVPFYGRHSRSGEWTTYEDLVQKHWPLNPNVDSVDAPDQGTIGFNGVDTIRHKTGYALQVELGGVMIWEVGQDCRLVPVVHGSTTHARTCPEDSASLLLSISSALTAAKRQRMRTAGWSPSQLSSDRGDEL
ncbi:unnamed protein product [Symbiodinium natans]|uniref:nitrile hydratase n=1 Tax=Symbiodinium natans TaxID=878477 RepID=A0A812PFW7_9DINO|nr:unnamed protein product [Symbiodinium natans]